MVSSPIEVAMVFGVALLLLGPKNFPRHGSGLVIRDPLLPSRSVKKLNSWFKLWDKSDS